MIDRDQLVRHIEALREGLPEELLTPLWSKRGGSHYVRHAEAAVGLAAGDFYVGVGLITAPTAKRIGRDRRPQANDIAGLPGLWLDLDVKGSPKGNDGVKATGAESVQAAMDAAHLIADPTLMILSGGGVHAWWLFDEPLIFGSNEEREQARIVVARWQQAHRLAAGIAIDSTHDLPRLMRLAGTRNHKGGNGGAPVTFAPEHDGPRHSYQALAELVADVQVKAPSNYTALVQLNGQVPPERVAELVEGMSDSVGGFAATWRRQPDRFDGDDSRYDMAIGSHALRAGLSDSEAVALMQAHRVKHNPGDPKLRDNRYFALTLSKLHASGRTTAGSTREAVEEPLRTDAGNARRLVAAHGRDLRFVPGIGWHTWDERRWRRDLDGEAMRRAKATVEAMRFEAANLAGDTTELFKHAVRSEGRFRLEAMVKLAESELPLIADTDDLDADPLLLNVRNGTLDLRTGELRAHSRNDLLTKLAGCDYDPNAACPRFEAFLAEVLDGDAELIAYVRRWAGYSLSGEVSAQRFPILHGFGLNGKTTLIETLCDVLGDYGQSADPTTFTTAASNRAARSDLARLRGARLVTAVEMPPDAQLNEALVKQLTGGDRVTARFLYRDEFDFRPQCKIWLAVNHLPAIQSDGRAMWRRVCVIPFSVEIARPNEGLRQELLNELPGILAWAVQGCLEWQRIGLGSCRAVEIATSSYAHRQDQIGAFVEDVCTVDPGARVEATALWSAYRAWCEALGTTLRARSSKELSERLSARGIGSPLKSNGKRFRVGLTLREDADSPAGTHRDDHAESPL